MTKTGICHEELGDDGKAIGSYRTALSLLKAAGQARHDPAATGGRDEEEGGARASGHKGSELTEAQVRQRRAMS